MPRPVHLEAETRCYLVTSNSDGRASTFADPEAARIIIDALYHLRLKGRMRLHAFVVMPDHLHFMVSLGAGETLSRLMHSLKSYTAKEINRKRGSKGTV